MSVGLSRLLALIEAHQLCTAPSSAVEPSWKTGTVLDMLARMQLLTSHHLQTASRHEACSRAAGISCRGLSMRELSSIASPNLMPPRASRISRDTATCNAYSAVA